MSPLSLEVKYDDAVDKPKIQSCDGVSVGYTKCTASHTPARMPLTSHLHAHQTNHCLPNRCQLPVDRSWFGCIEEQIGVGLQTVSTLRKDPGLLKGGLDRKAGRRRRNLRLRIKLPNQGAVSGP